MLAVENRPIEVEVLPEVEAVPFVHLVTLVSCYTGFEKTIEVCTSTERFVDVMRRICEIRAELKLQGYQVFEVLPISGPAPF